MSINKRLEEVYKLKWHKLISNGHEMANDIVKKTGDYSCTFNDIISKDIKRNKKLKDIPSNPLLLKVNEIEIENADIKVMIFGQETFGWHRFGIEVEDEMKNYAKYFYDTKKTNKFWSHGVDFFRKELTEFYAKQDKTVAFVWNNISKIGRYQQKAGVPNNIRALERKYFHSVVKEEVKIINPDIIIFLTGSRDNDIKFNFENTKFENIHYKATLKSKNGKLTYKKAQQVILEDFSNIKCVKLYHPAFFGGFNNIKHDALNFLKL